MARFSNSSRSSQKLWDPTKTLGIINTDPGYEGITCVGYAPSQRRRCRKPINKFNRGVITDTLEEISYLQPNDPTVLSRLKNIAGTALCIQFHQSQASDVLSQWRSKLPKVQKIDCGTKTRTSAGRARNQTWKDLQEQLRKLTELMEEFEENMQGKQCESSSDEESEEETSEQDSSDYTSDEESGGDSSTREYQKKENERKEKERLQRDRLDKERKEREARERRETYKEQDRRREQERATKAKEERERKEREVKEAREAEQAAESERNRRRRAAEERAEKAARERREREEQEKERIERERVEKERKDQEDAKRKRDAENAASNERIRQRARERAEKAAREKREKEEREQAEWDQAWVKYQDKWAKFRVSSSGDVDLREAIPWPVKSGLLRDVAFSNVKTFLENSLPKGTDRAKLLRKECQKWHPDSVCRWSRASEMTDSYRMSTDMICKVVTDMLNVSSGRSSDFC
ncbi:hypothetical protein DL98DRAFT_515809 [Cadophora sp. DSE1049]|nr:hypothetical protein DL98DRAFT_515809 [Cadophora sp. DSE1049]